MLHLCLFILLNFLQSHWVNSFECDLVIRYVQGFGIGVYAGKIYQPNKLFLDGIGIPIPDSTRINNELSLFVEYLNSTHDIMVLGYALMINHVNQYQGTMLTKELNSRLIKTNKLHFKYHNYESINIAYINKWTIFPGDQVFIHYGDDWFSSRGFAELNFRESLNRDLTHIDNVHNATGRIPGCSPILTKFQNNKLYSASTIKKGQIIEVSRALLLPEHENLFTSGALTELIWWKPHEQQEKLNQTILKDYLYTLKSTTNLDPYFPTQRYAVVMLGNGLLYSGIENDKMVPNVLYAWWDPASTGLFDESDLATAEEDQVCRVEYPRGYDEPRYPESTRINPDGTTQQLCIKSYRRTSYGEICKTRMFISFTALHDIAEGTELVVDLSVDQLTGRRYPARDFADQCM